MEEIKSEAKKEQAYKKIMRCACDNKHKAIAVLVLALIVIGAGVYFYKIKKTDIGSEAAKKTITDFVNKNLLQPGTTATIKSIAKEGSLYKAVITVGTQDITTYITKDGKTFFPQALDVNPATSAGDQSGQQAGNQDIPKSDTPDVRLFVMSYCPFGTQIEKGILPVISALGTKIKYSLEFVDYSMHGDKEIAENLRQYCIEKTQPAKLSAYLTCFLKKGEGTSDACLASSGVNKSQMTSCVAQTDAQFSVTKNAADKSTWSSGQFPPFDVNKDDNTKYGVQGSPTLVINGVVDSSAGRDPASLLKAICGAFNDPPKECSAQLSSVAPAAGFGEGAATGTASGAACGTQ